MKKLVIPVLLGLMFCLHPFVASAKNICWTDGFSFFALSGGKPLIKPFAGKFVSPGSGCHGVLTASIVRTGPGVITVSIEGNIPAPCVNFAIYGTTTDPALNFSGPFDNSENATADGTAVMTIINCNTVPSTPLTSPIDKSALPSKPVPGYNPPQAESEN